MSFDYSLDSDGDYVLDSQGNYVSHLRIDSFEDNDIAEYSDLSGRYRVIQDSALAVDGSYLLDFVGSQGSGAGLVSTAGLPRYPSPGDTIVGHSEFLYAADFGGIQFACQTESDTFPDGYRCQIDGGQDRIEIIKQTGGGGTFDTLATASLNLSNHLNEPLRHRVPWGTDGSITYAVLDDTGTVLAETPTVTDTTYSSGGFGWASETNSNLDAEQHVYHDHGYLVPG